LNPSPPRTDRGTTEDIMQRLITLITAIAMAGCATTGANFAPIVDLRDNQPRDQYSTDLLACQQYAQQQAGAADRAMAGAVAGAVFGALLAAAAGGSYSRNASAGVGAVTGMAAGAGEGERDQRNVIKRCLAGRGYLVLN
jgi:outer membrane lipoprotein SlyB